MYEKRFRYADQLLNELGIFEPEDIRIEAIAQFCGATIIYKPLSGCAARLLGRGDEAIISVAEDSNRGRQRFSAAHELGHWLYHRNQISSVFSCEEQVFWRSWGPINHESQANLYAAELLMPESMFKSRSNNLPITFQSVRQLTSSFQTSLTATAIRLVKLGSFPAMIVCNTQAKREWFIRGPDVPDCVWPTDTPGRQSIAYDLLRGKSECCESAHIQANNWISHSTSPYHLIHEDSFRLNGGQVISLLWWKDESQLAEIEERENI